jgi:capsular exopolysaccharide synthesis family protein
MDKILEALARAKQDDGKPESEAQRAEPRDAARPAGGRGRVVEPINPAVASTLSVIAGRLAEEYDSGMRPPPARPVLALVPTGRGTADAGHARRNVSGEGTRATQSAAEPREPVVALEALRAKRVIAGDAEGAAAQAYRVLATQVLQLLRENEWQVLAVVSPGFGEGKTLTAINLAIALSWQSGQTAVLVDADLRDPKVHAFLDLPPQPGLSDHLVQGVALDAALVDPGLGNVVVLPGGRALRSGSELLGSEKMQAVVTALKQRYPAGIMVIDVPPVLMGADARAFAPCAEAVLMVLEEGRTPPADAARAAEALQSANLIGTVLNKSNFSTIAASLTFARRMAEAGPRQEPKLNTVLHEDGRLERHNPPAPVPAAPRKSAWRRILGWFAR